MKKFEISSLLNDFISSILKIPLWVRILRILEIKSFSSEEISNFLKEDEKRVYDEIENLRKNQLILMSPQRRESKIIKIYEILPEGVEKLRIVHKLRTNLNFL